MRTNISNNFAGTTALVSEENCCKRLAGTKNNKSLSINKTLLSKAPEPESASIYYSFLSEIKKAKAINKAMALNFTPISFLKNLDIFSCTTNKLWQEAFLNKGFPQGCHTGWPSHLT